MQRLTDVVRWYLARLDDFRAEDATPDDRAERQAQLGLAEADLRAAVAQRTVLIVDDDPAIGALLVRVLDGVGATLIRTTTPAAALEAIPAIQNLAVLITDVILPGMSGIELAMLAHKAVPGLHVIYMTGHPSFSIGAQLLPEDVVVVKPFDIRAMRTLVESRLA